MHLVEEYLLTGFQLAPFSNWHVSSHGKSLNWSANMLKITERSRWSHARNYCKIAAKSTVLYSRWKGFLVADNWPNKIIAATNQSMDANLKAIDAVNTQFAVFFTRLSIGTTTYVNLYQVKGFLVSCWWTQLSLMTIYYIKEERWSRAKRNTTYPQIVLACL